MPTEAEWEYCCRAGKNGLRYCYGNDDAELEAYAWIARSNKSRSRRTNTVGQKKANAWGLYDMHGNVWEWCQDWYDADYYKRSPKQNPPGPSTGSKHVCRGGSHFFSPPLKPTRGLPQCLLPQQHRLRHRLSRGPGSPPLPVWVVLKIL